MPRVSKPIEAQLIEYACDCGKGVYRLKYKQPYTSDCRYTWLHECSHCGRELEFTTPYPLLEVVPGNVRRRFMLEEARPTPMVEKYKEAFKWYSSEGLSKTKSHSS
jgi:hypothetical protein